MVVGFPFEGHISTNALFSLKCHPPYQPYRRKSGPAVFRHGLRLVLSITRPILPFTWLYLPSREAGRPQFAKRAHWERRSERTVGETRLSSGSCASKLERGATRKLESRFFSEAQTRNLHAVGLQNGRAWFLTFQTFFVPDSESDFSDFFESDFSE